MQGTLKLNVVLLFAAMAAVSRGLSTERMPINRLLISSQFKTIIDQINTCRNEGALSEMEENLPIHKLNYHRRNHSCWLVDPMSWKNSSRFLKNRHQVRVRTQQLKRISSFAQNKSTPTRITSPPQTVVPCRHAQSSFGDEHR